MSDNVTLEIPIDEARRLLKQYPNSRCLKDAVKEWDEEHKPPARYRLLETLSEEELRKLRRVWPEKALLFSPNEIVQRLVWGEVEKVEELVPTLITPRHSND